MIHWSARNYIWLALAIGAQAADLVSTDIALKNGGVEGNFIVGPAPDLQILVLYKILLIASFYFCAEIGLFGSSLIRNRAFALLTALGLGGAVWNTWFMWG